VPERQSRGDWKVIVAEGSKGCPGNSVLLFVFNRRLAGVDWGMLGPANLAVKEGEYAGGESGKSSSSRNGVTGRKHLDGCVEENNS